jgi:uncharacterized protein (TIGR03437 family)
VTPVPSGGYFVTIVNQNGQIFFDVFDAAFHLMAESSSVPAFIFADMNGDGKLDAISTGFVNHNAGISIALGNGGTSFQPPVVYSTNFPSIQALLIADVNGDGDGKPDFLALGWGVIALYLGNGDGTLQPPKIILQEKVFGFSMALADLNGDGILDLVYGDMGPTYEPAINVALGVGDGTFQPAVAYPAAGGGITIGDLNGDGIPDILASGGTILFGDGKGGFPTRRDIAFGSVASGTPIITDFDGDGIADIVFGLGNAAVIGGDSVSVIFGAGKGNFSAPPVSLIPGYPSSGSSLTALASSDLDGDGIPDLVAVESSGHISVMKGVGDGTFQNTLQYQISAGIPYGVVFGDFNHDGHTDFAVAGSGYITSGSPAISIWLGNGDGTFQSPTRIPAPVGAFALATGDFNGDGKLDLAVLVSQAHAPVSDSFEILLGNGDGTFKVGASYAVGPNANSIVAGDFNGDGKLDLVVTNNGTDAKNGADTSILIFAGKGDGTFANPATLPYVGGRYRRPFDAIAADFNGDGKLDLAVTLTLVNNYLSGLMILLGHGDGTFQPPAYYAVQAYTVASGDLNGDGIIDLVVSGPATSYMLGNGDGTFKSPVSVPGAGSPVAVADLNHDGKFDLAANVGSGIGGYLNIAPPVPPITMVSAASLEPAPIAPSSIVTAFGKNLSGTATSVSVADSTGVSSPATLFYVSPSQINFVVPSGLEAGPGTVTISSGAGTQTAPIELAPVQPSLFTLNAGGLAAAYVTRASSSGATYEPVFTAQNGVFTPVPIDVSAAAGQAYLVLFGTGIRNSASAYASINGNFFPVYYAGPQPEILGLDQVNLALPSNLSGSGYTNIILSQGSLTANPVYIVIK